MIDLSKARTGQRYEGRDGIWTYDGIVARWWNSEILYRFHRHDFVSSYFTKSGLHIGGDGNDIVRLLDEPAPAPGNVAIASHAADTIQRVCLAMVEESTRQKDAAEHERDKALADEKIMHETLISERENWAKDSMTIVGARLDALKERDNAAVRVEALTQALKEAGKVVGPFNYRTYRCEWVTEIFGVDQYDQRTKDCEVYYSQAWPTKAEAQLDLERIAHLNEVTGRWVSNMVSHSYHNGGVAYRELVI